MSSSSAPARTPPLDRKDTVVAVGDRDAQETQPEFLRQVASASAGKFILGLIGYHLVYWLAYRCGMSFSQEVASPFWFPDSVLLCALLLTPARRWWSLVIFLLPLRLLATASGEAPAWFIGATWAIDCAKGLGAATVLRRILADPTRLTSMREYSWFCLVAVLLVPIAGAFAGASTRVVLGYPFWPAWEQWFMGNLLTQIVITPTILCWVVGFRANVRSLSWPRRIEGLAIFALLIPTLGHAFNSVSAEDLGTDPGFYLPIPLLFWAAVRFGVPGASAAIFTVAVIAVGAALQDGETFRGGTPASTAAILQHFLLLRAVPVYAVAVVIEQRNAIEKSLRQSEERYREVVESQTNLVCRYRDDCVLTFVNEAYCRFFGRTREQLIGHSFLEQIPASSHERVREFVAGLFRDKRPTTYEHEVLRADGTMRWQQWTDYPILDDQGAVVEFQAIGHDVTDRKRAEEANRELAHASRLTMAGELTASIAHEINQPLGAILSNADAAEILLDRADPPLTEIREILADIRRDDVRAGEVIQHLRALLRKREVEKHALNLNDLVSGVMRIAAGDLQRRRISADLQLALPSAVVVGDRVHLEQVLLNLVINAMDAMSEPGPVRRLTVRTRRRDDGQAEVTVTDTGHGIPPDKLPRIFESFVTTKKDGMGLGLSIARSLIEAHAGRIQATNNPDGGATFAFTLPARDGTGSA